MTTIDSALFTELKSGDRIRYLGQQYTVTSSIVSFQDQYGPGVSYCILDNNPKLTLSSNCDNVWLDEKNIKKLKDGILVLLN